MAGKTWVTLHRPGHPPTHIQAALPAHPLLQTCSPPSAPGSPLCVQAQEGTQGAGGVVSSPACKARTQGSCGMCTSHLASLENWVFSGEPRNSNTHREAWGSCDSICNALSADLSLEWAPTTPAILIVIAGITHPGSRLAPSCAGTSGPGAEQAASPDRRCCPHLLAPARSAGFCRATEPPPGRETSPWSPLL